MNRDLAFESEALCEALVNEKRHLEKIWANFSVDTTLKRHTSLNSSSPIKVVYCENMCLAFVEALLCNLLAFLNACICSSTARTCGRSIVVYHNGRQEGCWRRAHYGKGMYRSLDVVCLFESILHVFRVDFGLTNVYFIKNLSPICHVALLF